MKGTFLIAIIVIFSMLVIPLSALTTNQETFIPTSNAQNNILYEKNEPLKAPEKIKVLKDGEVYEYAIKDYIFGVVAAEMPALYHQEALKAQAVAAYTFACYKKNGSTTDYDISADPKVAQCFITREEAASRWGEKSDQYTKKIDDCINAVDGEVLTFEGKPIFAAFHAISGGSTNDCADVWGKTLPYLKSVDSSGDTLSEGYLSEKSFTIEEIAQKLKHITTPHDNPQTFFTDINAAANGYVKTLKFCGTQTTGSSIAEALELRSSNFTVKFDNDVFTFVVKGYGHGVGMSQTGADYMAKQGSSYKEILLHYYKGAKIEKN